jgi:hypothetical protein
MAVAALFPSPGDVEANTPATRDRAIDVIRIVSLAGVVVGHTIMATSTLRDGVFFWSNLLTASPIFQALTWVFQIMPLFFFAGVAACVAGAATLASVGWGLKEQGLYLVAVMIVTLVGARLLAVDGQRVCAASRPARMT